MGNREFSFIALILILCGLILGISLAGIQSIETFKLLNVIGTFYNILGVVILSQIVSKSEKFKNFIANIFSGLVLWAHLLVPIGISIGVSFKLIFFLHHQHQKL